MQPEDVLKNMYRPTILIHTARLSQNKYRRKKGLKKLLCTQNIIKPDQIFVLLLEIEKRMEIARNQKCLTYNMKRHIYVLTAIMHEAQLLSEQQL